MLSSSSLRSNFVLWWLANAPRRLRRRRSVSWRHLGIKHIFGSRDVMTCILCCDYGINSRTDWGSASCFRWKWSRPLSPSLRPLPSVCQVWLLKFFMFIYYWKNYQYLFTRSCASHILKFFFGANHSNLS